jgi:flagella basal body P-ring formation protein FlgA
MIRLAAIALVALALPAAAQIPAVQVSAPNAPLPFTERFAPTGQRSAGPTLKSAATVIGEIVRIGDLVENAGAAAHVAIFRAPDLGDTGRVAVSQVIDALLPHDINPDTRGLTEIVVARASHVITAADIEMRVVQALAGRQRGTSAGNLTLSFDSDIRTIHVEPATDLRIARLNFDPRSGRFDVLFERPGGQRNLLRFTGTYAETFEAAVLTRPLAIGEIVKAADINIARRPKAEFAAGVVTGADQALGLAARRAMRPGEMLRQTDLAKPEVVARNDNVTITYHVPGITLTLRGKALDGGAHGDTINVLNVMSKRSIQATVAGPGHVILAAPVRINVTSTTTAPRLAAHTTGRSTPTPQAHASAE